MKRKAHVHAKQVFVKFGIFLIKMYPPHIYSSSSVSSKSTGYVLF